MFDRIQRSVALLRASLDVLRQDNRQILFPVLSATASLLVLAAFLLPVFGFRSIDGLRGTGKDAVYSFAFLFYVVQYFIITYFNAALVGATLVRLAGGTPTLADGLRIANGRIGAILGFAVISATVGVVLRMIQERVGFLGRLVTGLIGAAWAIATYLAVPVIVAEERDTFAAISESSSLVRRTWGENLVGQGGLGLVFTLVYFALIGGATLAVGLGAHAVGAGAIVAFLGFVVLAILLCAVLQSTLAGILSAVMYRYALDGSGTPGFGGEVLATAFQRKG
jgi:hypothetical protein